MDRRGYVDHSTTGIIAADNNPGQLVLLDNGDAWLCHSGQWSPYDEVMDLPVPVSEIKFLVNFQQFYGVAPLFRTPNHLQSSGMTQPS